jgi:hypothetical protein
MPHRELTVDVAAHGDAEAGTGGAAGLLSELKGDRLERHHVVLAHDALFLLAQNAVELDVAASAALSATAPPYEWPTK